MTAAERTDMVRACHHVDEIVPDCPPILTQKFLNDHEIDYVARDDEPLAKGKADDYEFIKRQGKFLVTQRTRNISTTGLISRVIRDYDEYILRQLRRGVSRHEMRITWFKQFKLQVWQRVARTCSLVMLGLLGLFKR